MSAEYDARIRSLVLIFSFRISVILPLPQKIMITRAAGSSLTERGVIDNQIVYDGSILLL